mgnify:FL=1
MKKYFIKRFASTIPVLIGVTVLCFILMTMSGKDPALAAAIRSNSAGDTILVDSLREEMGLDKPLPTRYFLWLKGLLKGDMGKSVVTYHSITDDTGAAGYSAQENQKASSGNAAYGYINVACGNRGKQSTATDENGEEYYTGDAPLCLVDQKNAIRFVKYNIILGNLPGNTEYFVSTGGSGGGAHAAMVAATSDNSDYFPYETEAGAVGIYQNEDGTYSETIGSEDIEISDGQWGCVAYSAITSLQEADMAMAFEYYLDTDYEFNTDFQKKLAEYLSQEYMQIPTDTVELILRFI